jgi:hypothetical protein
MSAVTDNQNDASTAPFIVHVLETANRRSAHWVNGQRNVFQGARICSVRGVARVMSRTALRACEASPCASFKSA